MPAAFRYRLPVRSFFLPCSNKKFPVQLRREFGVQVLDSASCFGDRNPNLAPECAKFPVFSQISGNLDQRLFRWGLHPPPLSRAIDQALEQESRVLNSKCPAAERLPLRTVFLANNLARAGTPLRIR